MFIPTLHVLDEALFDKEAIELLEKSFGTDGAIPFSGAMFDPSTGAMTDTLKQTLLDDERTAIAKIETDYAGCKLNYNYRLFVYAISSRLQF